MLRMSKLARAVAKPVSRFIPFQVGLDQVTPELKTAPGSMRDCLNYEVDINKGYAQSVGYERFDGRPAPSDAIYYMINVTISASIAVGNTVTGATSGATGYVVAVNTTYDEAQAFLILTKVTGTFVDAENLTVAAVVKANTDSAAYAYAAPTLQLDAFYRNAAADVYRADIAAVPGEGKVRGVWVLSDITYAVRNAVGSASAALFKKTAGGWSAVSLGRELSFTSGGTEPATGAVTLTGGAGGSVDGITVNGVQIMSGAVAYATSLSNTASLVAANITAFASTPNYTATALGAAITITASTSGAGSNGYVVAATTTTITTSTANMAGGHDSYTPAEGSTITGATSGATAVLTRVVLQSGSWDAGTASGRFIFASQTGTFQSENLNIAANLNVATIAGNSSAITLLPNGRYQTVVENFGGQAGTTRVYGCDKVNRGFEFDGTVFVPIVTGMTADAPTHVEVFKKHLFFSFASSAQHSGVGTPYIWSPVFGAAEIAVGDTITAFHVLPGSNAGEGSLAILCRNRTNILYGSSSANWNLVKYRREVGGYEYTVQEAGLSLLYDDRGIAALSATQDYGNFKSDSVTQLVQPFVNQRRGTATASCISRDKSQYRLFFADKYALYVTLSGDKVIGITPQYLADKVECMDSVELSDGSEAIFFGSDDGFVYQMEKGTSHDGDPIERRFTLHYFNAGTPREIKKWLDASMEIKGTGYAEFYFSFQIGYALPDVPQPDHQQELVLAEFTAAEWDAFIWDNFIWDGVYLSPLTKKLEGSAENMAIIIRSTSDYFYPLTFSGAHVRYSARRQMRS